MRLRPVLDVHRVAVGFPYPGVLGDHLVAAIVASEPGAVDRGVPTAEPGVVDQGVPTAEPEVVDHGSPTARPEVVGHGVPTAGLGVVDHARGAGVSTPGLPKSGGSPSTCRVSKCSSYAQLAREVRARSSRAALSIDGPDTHVSTLGAPLDKTTGHLGNNPNPGHSTANGTSAPATDATTNRRRKKRLRECPGQRRHKSRAVRPAVAAQKI